MKRRQRRPPPTRWSATLMAFDKNRDGKLTKAEVPERMQGMFERADANHDGVLTADEIKAAAAAQPQPAGEPAPAAKAGAARAAARAARRRDALFSALDKDGDGTLSADEIAGAAARAAHARHQRRRQRWRWTNCSAAGRTRLIADHSSIPAQDLLMRLRYVAAVPCSTAATAVASRSASRAALPVPLRERARHVDGGDRRRGVRKARRKSATAAVLDRIDRDAKILSGYDPSSEFSQLVRDARTRRCAVSAELYEVLGLFDAWRDSQRRRARRVRGNGLARLEAGRLAQRVPTDGEIAAAVALARQPHWRLDRVARTATHLDHGADRPELVHQELHHRPGREPRSPPASARGIVVNIGGDLVARGAWTETVGITNPLDNADNAAPLTRLAVSDRAVATSGNYRRGFDIAGRHYSHIVDPRTGRPNREVISATVVAGAPPTPARSRRRSAC